VHSAHATSPRPLRRAAAAVSAAVLAGVLLGTVPVEAPAASAQSSQGCNAATRIGAAPPALSMLQSELAWTITKGAGVTVAVVDSGVDAGHVDLRGQVLPGLDLVDQVGEIGQATHHSRCRGLGRCRQHHRAADGQDGRQCTDLKRLPTL